MVFFFFSSLSSHPHPRRINHFLKTLWNVQRRTLKAGLQRSPRLRPLYPPLLSPRQTTRQPLFPSCLHLPLPRPLPLYFPPQPPRPIFDHIQRVTTAVDTWSVVWRGETLLLYSGVYLQMNPDLLHWEKTVGSSVLAIAAIVLLLSGFKAMHELKIKWPLLASEQKRTAQSKLQEETISPNEDNDNNEDDSERESGDDEDTIEQSTRHRSATINTNNNALSQSISQSNLMLPHTSGSHLASLLPLTPNNKYTAPFTPINNAAGVGFLAGHLQLGISGHNAGHMAASGQAHARGTAGHSPLPSTPSSKRKKMMPGLTFSPLHDE
eukprot:g75108.t1